MQQVITVEQVQQERTRVAAAIDNLARKQSAATALAAVLSLEGPTVAQLKEAFAAYYAAESLALQHDVVALRDQVEQLDRLEKHVRLQASGLVVAAPTAGRTR